MLIAGESPDPSNAPGRATRRQGYAPGEDGAFAQSRECYGELEDWLASEDAARLQHGELEQLDVRGRELLRRLFQGRLDLLAAQEEPELT
jgi:hypothetical protein